MKKYTSNPKPWTYPDAVRQKALHLYGVSLDPRRLASPVLG